MTHAMKQTQGEMRRLSGQVILDRMAIITIM